MSIQQLNVIAGKVLAMASSLPYRSEGLANPTVDDQVRDSNEGIERLLSAVVGYAFPLPTEPVASPKLWFGEQYGQTVGTFVSLVGEQRILNPELIAVGAQGAWLYRYATTFDITLLPAFGQTDGCRIAGLNCLSDYCYDGATTNSATALMAISQMGGMVRDFHEVLLKDSADA